MTATAVVTGAVAPQPSGTVVRMWPPSNAAARAAASDARANGRRMAAQGAATGEGPCDAESRLAVAHRPRAAQRRGGRRRTARPERRTGPERSRASSKRRRRSCATAGEAGGRPERPLRAPDDHLRPPPPSSVGPPLHCRFPPSQAVGEPRRPTAFLVRAPALPPVASLVAPLQSRLTGGVWGGGGLGRRLLARRGGESYTNAFPGLTSHKERAAAQLRSALASEPGHHGHGHEQHPTPTDESTWMSLMPRRPRRALRREEAFDWLMLHCKLLGAAAGVTRGGAFLSEVSLHDVRLELGSILASPADEPGVSASPGRRLPRLELPQTGRTDGGGLPEGEHAPSSSHRYSSLTCLSPASSICGLLLSCGVRGALLLLPGELVLGPFLGDSA
ncbi:uncharacterized protein C2845_PM02G32670 [Panicum miliaceum]|uniref:Uncharacterized protein n=1 Tax=Panicum miliaceum TaxID=4540 RepID=A0A3L6S4K1_PANMI|nr:uncharacterized protein C2845_PM02G32670 [Panicum miliaceum]